MTNEDEKVVEPESDDVGITASNPSEDLDLDPDPEVDEEARRRAQDHFREAVATLKAEHGGSLMQVNLMTDPEVVRAVAAWPSVPREVRPDAPEKTDPWDMVYFASGLWMEAARIPRSLESSVLLTIRQNHLVYPDGTMPQQVRAYLIRRGSELIGLPAPGG